MFAGIEKFFLIRERNSKFITEVAAGVTTFAAMSYIIFLQPMIMSGRLFKMDTGMDFNALIAGTCIASAFASILMGALANYPIALAPGMGENFFFVLTALPLCAGALGLKAGDAGAWKLALGVVFLSGLIFLLISFLNIRKLILESISPSLKSAIVGGIGFFIALIGLRNSGLICIVNNNLTMAENMKSAAIAVFFIGLVSTAVLNIYKVRGSILWGIIIGTVSALLLGETSLVFPFSLPPDPSPVFARMDLVNIWPLLYKLLPLILIFTFMDVFDTMGTIIAVGTHAGIIKDNKLPNSEKAFAADACGTLFGSVCGHSTVTAFIESATGVEYGGKTGLTAVVTGLCFIAALFAAPFVNMVAHCNSITAPALVIVGAMMIKSISNIEWDDYSEAAPAFLILTGIPFTYSIADGMTIGFIAYPVIKLLGGKGRQIGWLTYLIGVILLLYLLFIRNTI